MEMLCYRKCYVIPGGNVILTPGGDVILPVVTPGGGVIHDFLNTLCLNLEVAYYKGMFLCMMV